MPWPVSDDDKYNGVVCQLAVNIVKRTWIHSFGDAEEAHDSSGNPLPPHGSYGESAKLRKGEKRAVSQPEQR